MIRYISDLHLWDVATVNWRSDMDWYKFSSELIYQWNYLVHSSDITFILGDLGRECKETIDTIRQLNGIKILVQGNHDKDWSWTEEELSLFGGIHDYILSNGVLMIHRPKDRLNFKYDWCIHGHLHDYEAEKLAGDYKAYIRETNRVNCAVDMNGSLHPYTFAELMYNKACLIDEKPY